MTQSPTYSMPASARISRVRCDLGERRPEPAARPRAGALLDCVDDVVDDLLLFILGLAVDQRRVVVTVAHPFPAELLAALDDARIFAADVGVERHGALDAVFFHHLHHAPDADAHAVVAPGVVQHVRHELRGHRSNGRGWSVEQKMLDVRNDPERYARAVRPAQRLTVDDGGIREPIMLLRSGQRLRHIDSPLRFYVDERAGRHGRFFHPPGLQAYRKFPVPAPKR